MDELITIASRRGNATQRVEAPNKVTIYNLKGSDNITPDSDTRMTQRADTLTGKKEVDGYLGMAMSSYLQKLYQWEENKIPGEPNGTIMTSPVDEEQLKELKAKKKENAEELTKGSDDDAGGFGSDSGDTGDNADAGGEEGNPDENPEGDAGGEAGPDTGGEEGGEENNPLDEGNTGEEPNPDEENKEEDKDKDKDKKEGE